MKLNSMIKVGLAMIIYSSILLGGHIEGNLRLGGFLYQWGLEFPIFFIWIFGIIDLIAIWYIFHHASALFGIYFGGSALYALVKTGDPNVVMALGAFYGLGLIVVGFIKFGLYEND